MLIVLGGTRKVEKLPAEIGELIIEFVNQNPMFYVGDAPGIDTAFQKFLKALKVKDVTVFSSADRVRNNLGNWSEIHVDSPIKSKSHARHSIKDRYMTARADLGIMVWDAQSAGTLANVIDLLQMKKECFLFNLIDGDLVKFDNLKSLENYLMKFEEVRDEANRRLNTFRKREKRMKSNINGDIDFKLF